MKRAFVFLATLILCGVTATAVAQPLAVSTPAPDFPPGQFTDGNSYRLRDLRGKVVVLTFFDPIAGETQAVRKHKAVMKAMMGKPVKFIGVGVNIKVAAANDFARQVGLDMPLFADSFDAMDTQYGIRASVLNPWVNVVIDPEGKIAAVACTPEELDQLIESSKAMTKFTTLDISPRYLPLADLFESGQFSVGVKQLAAARIAPKADAKSLDLLQTTLKQEATAWRAEAEAIAVMDPLRSYDLCNRIAFLYPGSELGKSVQDPLRRLAAEPSVRAELNARVAFQKPAQTMSLAMTQKTPLATAFAEVAKKHPDTPTGSKAKAIAEALGYKAAAPKKK